MFLRYQYGEKWYTTLIDWTAVDGKSSVFSNILRTVSHQHKLDVSPYERAAAELDRIVDKLYAIIYTFSNERQAVPYDPKITRRLRSGIAELELYLEAIGTSSDDEVLHFILALYRAVLDKLRQTTHIFLEEARYRSKHYTRKRRKEQSIETTDERAMSYEFENMILLMTDLSHMLACLTPIQRERLVKHVFLHYTMQEIADAEHVANQTVQRSISLALKKLKDQFSQ